MADQYDDVDYYRWVRTDEEGYIVVSRPYNKRSTVQSRITHNKHYGNQKETYRIQFLAHILWFDGEKGIQTRLEWRDYE